MRVGFLLTACMAVALAGCETETVPGGTAPFVSRDPVKWQSKVTHAVNWQELAERSVLAIPWSGAGADKFPVYVASGPDIGALSPFALVYRQFLEEQLLKANYPVVQSPADARIVVDFDIHPLVYADVVTYGEDTPSEVVVSTRIADGSHVHFLRMETVYVKPSDLALYEPPAPELPMVSLPVNAVRQ